MNVDFRRKVATSIACLLLILCTTFAFGQGIVTGSISGTAIDPQGAVIVGAKVNARNTATNLEFSGVTSGTGAYQLRGLPSGNYDVTIEAANFQKLVVKNVAVSVGVDTTMGAQKLTVGAASETVTVEATAPLIETQTSQLSSTFENKQATDLPIGTAFDNLALLVPGVASAGDASFSNSNGVDLSVNGQRGRSNNFQIDGQSNNDNSVAGPSLFLGNQDIISEIQVISNNFSAEYGRNMGSVINYVTKSGTNNFHGTLFEFFTGNFTFSHANQEKSPVFGFCPSGVTAGCSIAAVPKYVENRFGGTVGGPIRKDKMWFFAGLMKDEVAQNFIASTGSFTPTPAGLLLLENTYCGVAFTLYTPTPCPSHPGLGSLLMNGPYANSNGNPTPGTVADSAVTDGVTTLAAVPFGTMSRQILGSSTDWEVMGRVDWQLTSKDRIFSRYQFQDLLFLGGTGRFDGGAWVDEPGRTQQIAVDWVRNFTDHFINQARFSFSRAFFGFEGESGAPAGWKDCLVKSINSCKFGVTMNNNMVSYGYQNNLPQDRLVNNSQWQDNASWVHGRHTVKFGGEYDRQRSPNSFLPNVNGTFSFNCFSVDDGGPLNPCASSRRLMVNNPVRLSLTDGPVAFNFKEQDAGFYLQDDWRIKDNLTLNIGVRWEFEQQAINLLNTLTTARETGPTPFWLTTLPLAQRTVPAVPNDLNNWGPNIGFAYTPRIWPGLFGKDKTVIRGGFRIAYDPAYYNIFLNVATSAPTVNAASLTGAVSRTIPAGASTGADVRLARLAFMPLGVDPGFRTQTHVSPDFHNPEAYQWSFDLQRELTSKIVVEARYVGNHTVGNFQTVNGNPSVCQNPGFFGDTACLATEFPSLIPAGLSGCTTPGTPGFAETRIDCTHALVRKRDNGAWAIYHGLQTELRIRSWHGWTGGLEYTWSKSIDNVSEIFSTFAGGNAIAGSMDPFDPNQKERGVGGTSYSHVLTGWFIYQFPWYKSQQGFTGHVLGGWQMNGIYQWHSGQPFNPIYADSFSIGGFCDPNFFLTFFGGDTCRPILADPTAPLDTVGQCIGVPCTGANLINAYTGAPGTGFHWIINDTTAGRAFGNPYLGVGRNTLRGQTINNLDFSVYKDIKVTEGARFQLQFNAFNVFNRQFRGTPDPLIDDGQFNPAGSVSTGFGGSFMNNFFNGSNRRSMTFGLKFIF